MIFINGWRPISEYSRDKYDWVLIKYFDGDFECLPEVAEMRTDGNWYTTDEKRVIGDVRFFFVMKELDTKIKFVDLPSDIDQLVNNKQFLDKYNNLPYSFYDYSACEFCSNNPKNGGYGNCNCTLPSITHPVTCISP